MGIVQVKQGSSALATLTVTLDASTTAGNTLIVAVASSGTSTNPTTFAVTLGGSAGNFAQDSASGSSSDAAGGAVWRDSNCAGGQTAVAITGTGGVGTIATTATVWECDDLAVSPFDQTAGSLAASGTTWTSTATPATTQATERCFGAVFGVNPSTVTVTGPSSPWVNQAQVSQAQGTSNCVWMAGTLDLAATGAQTYNGTFSLGEQWVAKVATYKLAAGGATVTMGSALAATTAQPAAQIMSLTSPAYAATATDLGGGSGSWASPANAQGTGDGSFATWTAP